MFQQQMNSMLSWATAALNDISGLQISELVCLAGPQVPHYQVVKVRRDLSWPPSYLPAAPPQITWSIFFRFIYNLTDIWSSWESDMSGLGWTGCYLPGSYKTVITSKMFQINLKLGQLLLSTCFIKTNCLRKTKLHLAKWWLENWQS